MASMCSLPRDLLQEILLRLPAKDLCRLRAVCQTWRSLLSNPGFANAHAARHPGPLIITGYDLGRYFPEHQNEGIIGDILDVSGRVVKRIRAHDSIGRVMSIQLDLIGTQKWTGLTEGYHYQLLNPVTAAVCALPEGLAKEHARNRHINDYYKPFLFFGKVASTGQCKVLRMFDNSSDIKQLCEVCTLGNKDSQWRKKMAPQDSVYMETWKNVVIDGVVYFLSYLPDCIASFNLETEVWSEALEGPPSSLVGDDCWSDFSLATLNGYLVVVHGTRASPIDLWFLTDMAKGLWVKQYSIPPIPISVNDAVICPLVVLDDGRIVLIEMHGKGFIIRTYDPRSNTSTDVAVVGYCIATGLSTGSLLRLPTSAS